MNSVSPNLRIMIGAAISIAPGFCLLSIGEEPLPMLIGKVANDLIAKMKGHLMQVGFQP